MSDLAASWSFDDGTLTDSVAGYTGTFGAGSFQASWVGQGIYTPRMCSSPGGYGVRVQNFVEFAADSFTLELSHQPACQPQSYQLYALFSKGPAWSATNPTGVAVLNQTTSPYGSGNLYQFRYSITDAAGVTREVLSNRTDFSCATAHHVVAIRDRGTQVMRLYVDGVLEGEMAETLGDLWPGTTLHFGGANFEGGCGWGVNGGTMDAVALYRRALDAEEVATLHARWAEKKLVCGP
jgi:hypothetical protein